MGCASSAQTEPPELTGVVSVSPLKAVVAERRWTVADLQLDTVIGEGMFSRVRVAKIKDDPNEHPLALKILKKRDIVKLQQVEHVRTEKEILMNITHPFIVDLLGTFQDEGSLYMMMEYVNGGELHEYVQSQGGHTSNEAAVFFCSEIYLAVAFLHSRHVAHRDLKPQNLLISANGHVKLTDFGFAKVIKGQERSNTLVGTPEYVAPEIVRRTGHGLSVDWWAFGIMVYEILAGFTPFCAEDMDAIFEKIKSAPVDYPKHINPKAKVLISKLLTREEGKRLGSGAGGVDEVRKQAWFKGIDFNAVVQRTLTPPFLPPVNGSADTMMFLRYPERQSLGNNAISEEEQEMFRRFSTKGSEEDVKMVTPSKQRMYPDAQADTEMADAISFRY